MKLSPELENAFNEQMKNEFFSSNLYKNMEAYFRAMSLDGMGAWMAAQAGEEYGHGQKFFDFLDECNNRVEMREINAPKRDWGSPLEAFQYALNHEKFVTQSIHNLYEMALTERAHNACIFLHQFISEQNEELDMFITVIDRLTLAVGNSSALLDMDRELGARTT